METSYPPTSTWLTLKLTKPSLWGTGHSTIRFTYGASDHLDLTLLRKYRVPEDGGKAYTNTAPKGSNGALNMYLAEQLSAGLPKKMVEKGGLVAVMFNREAATLQFCSSRPYAVKIFVNGSNSITGAPLVETTSSLISQKRKVISRQKIQDYYITGEEKVDTYHTIDGKDEQFVTGTELVTIHVMPLKRNKMTIFVKKMDGREYTFSIEGLELGTRISELKELIQQSKDVRVMEQRLYLGGVLLDDSKFLAYYGICDGSTVELFHHTCPLASNNDPVCCSISVSPSSLDREENYVARLEKINIHDWDKENTLTFNLQFIDKIVLENLTGIKTIVPLKLERFCEDVSKADHTIASSSTTTSKTTQPDDDAELEKLIMSGLAGARMDLEQIYITKPNGGEKMPEFLLEEEKADRVLRLTRGMDNSWVAQWYGERRGPLSTWTKAVPPTRDPSPDRTGNDLEYGGMFVYED